MMRFVLEKSSSPSLSRHYTSLFRTSVAARLNNQSSTTKEVSPDNAAQAKAHRELAAKIEGLVRDKLYEEYPNEFRASWFSNCPTIGANKKAAAVATKPSPPLTLSSFQTLLALNGFQRVVTPSGTNNRLYLAEGVVASPPLKLSFNAAAIPFASGYQEFAKSMEVDNVGVFGDVHHMVRGSSKCKERLFVQPFPQSHLYPEDGETNTSTKSLSSKFPDFVEEDITLYRMVENSAARVIDKTYSGWTGLTQRLFVRPLKDARYRTKLAVKSANILRVKFQRMMEKSLAERAWKELKNAINGAASTSSNVYNHKHDLMNGENNQKNAMNVDLVAKSVNESGEYLARDKKIAIEDSSVETKRIESESSGSNRDIIDSMNSEDLSEEDNDPLETLVVLSSQPQPKKFVQKAKASRGAPIYNDREEIVESLTLYRRMTPSTRILALPDYYVLRHSSASTLVSVSLVVFGALPLAYRSYVFSIDYDWLVGSPAIAASVIATITYGIISQRWRARTSQSKTISEALGARVGARDEAALLLLKEGAIRTISDAIFIAKEKAESGEDPNGVKEAQQLPSRLTNTIGPVDPQEWAMEFGLVPKPNTTTTAKNEEQLEDSNASSVLDSQTTKTTSHSSKSLHDQSPQQRKQEL